MNGLKFYVYKMNPIVTTENCGLHWNVTATLNWNGLTGVGRSACDVEGRYDLPDIADYMSAIERAEKDARDALYYNLLHVREGLNNTFSHIADATDDAGAHDNEDGG